MALNLGASLSFSQSHSDSPSVIVQRDAVVTMRDGVRLRADIYRPNREGKFPVIVSRTPYGKQLDGTGMLAAQRGIVYVVEDCRGRYASEGVWYPFRVELKDGFDTVEWAAALPYSNTIVGLYGGSYAGATALLAAASKPPHLRAVAVIETGSNYYEGWTYVGGVFQQNFIETWASVLARQSPAADDKDASKRWHDWIYDLAQPIARYPIAMNVTEQEHSFYLDFLSHPTEDQYWRALSVDAQMIEVPVLMIAGWYDVFSSSTIKTFLTLRDHASSPVTRSQSRILIGPWTHGGFTRSQGEFDFGPDATKDITSEILNWLQTRLTQTDDKPIADPVSYFNMGENSWRQASSWPPVASHESTLYLSSNGHANSAAGDGILLRKMEVRSRPDSFTYDPSDPVPTLGGGLCCGVVSPGAFDQTLAESRQDVLVYTTLPLTHKLDITGTVRVRLFVRSTAPDTDFTAKLVDVSPDGKTRNLCDGIRRVTFLGSHSSSLRTTAGTELTIDLGSTSNTFPAGHAIRLEISSSNFPKFARNPNSTGAGLESTTSRVALNSILHDSSHPSALLLDLQEERDN